MNNRLDSSSSLHLPIGLASDRNWSIASRTPRPSYVDSHAHLDDPAFDRDGDEVIATAAAVGVTRLVNIGYRPSHWPSTIALNVRYPNVKIALGLHPHHADEYSADLRDQLIESIATADASAVGEIGLDFFRGAPDADLQRRVFIDQIELARHVDRPIVVHHRAAETDLIDVLSRFTDLPPVLLHSFDGTARLARFAQERNFIVGVGGLATRAASAALRAVLASVPIGSIVLETDAPYLSPTGSKDRRNVPANIPLIAAQLAPLWRVDTVELAARTTENAERLFGFASASAGDTANREVS